MTDDLNIVESALEASDGLPDRPLLQPVGNAEVVVRAAKTGVTAAVFASSGQHCLGGSEMFQALRDADPAVAAEEGNREADPLAS